MSKFYIFMLGLALQSSFVDAQSANLFSDAKEKMQNVFVKSLPFFKRQSPSLGIWGLWGFNKYKKGKVDVVKNQKGKVDVVKNQKGKVEKEKKGFLNHYIINILMGTTGISLISCLITLSLNKYFITKQWQLVETLATNSLVGLSYYGVQKYSEYKASKTQIS